MRTVKGGMWPVAKRLKSLRIVWAMLAFCLLSPHDAWANAEASGLRAAEHPDGITRMVIDLSQSINFTTRLAETPYRIVVDTESLSWNAAQRLARTVGPLAAVSYGEDRPGAHITLKLTRPAMVKSAFLMSPRDTAGWRLVVDIQNTSKQDFAVQAHSAPPPVQPPTQPTVKAADASPVPAAAPAPIIITSPAATPVAPVLAPPAPPPPSPPVMVTQSVRGSSPSLTVALPPPLPNPPPVNDAAAPVPATQYPEPPPQPVQTAAAKPVQPPAPVQKDHKKDKDTRQLIVIDPGHGGVDPGATGVSGIFEKYITYSMARDLQQQLEKTGHYRVHLTRDRDVFIPLRERTNIARQINADLFISLHADVVKDPDIRGLSVYTLSQNASDAEAQALADKENKSDLIAGIDLSHESSDVTNILIDLAQRETMNRSAGFAGEIVNELGREVPLLTNTHRFAGFAVLKSPDVPAVLIEMGYLSNPTDEKNLRQPEYRAKLARAISRAVDNYFLQGQKAKRP